jgi:hypothetical protein
MGSPPERHMLAPAKAVKKEDPMTITLQEPDATSMGWSMGRRTSARDRHELSRQAYPPHSTQAYQPPATSSRTNVVSRAHRAQMRVWYSAGAPRRRSSDAADTRGPRPCRRPDTFVLSIMRPFLERSAWIRGGRELGRQPRELADDGEADPLGDQEVQVRTLVVASDGEVRSVPADLFILDVRESDRRGARSVAAFTHVRIVSCRVAALVRFIDPLVDLARPRLVPHLLFSPISHGHPCAARSPLLTRRPRKGGRETGDHSPSPPSRRSDRSVPLRRYPSPALSNASMTGA